MLCSGSSWEVSSCFPAQPAACLCACTSPLHFGELMTDSFPSQLLPPRNRRGGVPVSQKQHAAQIEFSQTVCVSASVHKEPCSLQLGAWQFEWEVGLVTSPSFDLYSTYLRWINMTTVMQEIHICINIIYICIKEGKMDTKVDVTSKCGFTK